MSENLFFNQTVADALGNYVYRLIDPRNGETFYVGKGKGNRVFHHISATLTLESDEDNLSAKIARIHAIRDSGLEVIHVIHRHAIPDEALLEVEAALIDAFSGLSNIAGGHGSGDRGPMHPVEIIDKYDLPVIDFEPEHRLVLINVNRFAESGSENLYRQVRFAWRLDRGRAEKADYVLAVVRGVVRGVFVANRWGPATREYFPEVEIEEPHRFGFEGRLAPEDVQDIYVGQRGKRIAIDGLRHVQNPVRYWNV